jgi:NAD(P)-dependent dehydrogenase (short-subunit alcohol dehydrogenase family)
MLALVDGRTLVFREAVGPVSEYLRGVSIELGAGIAGWVAQNNAPIVVPDVRTDPRFFGGVDERTGFVTRALACVPIRIGNEPIGVIEVVNPASGAFDSETLEQLDSLASLAGTAIAQARRVAEIQAAEMRFVGLFEDSLEPILISDLDGTQQVVFFTWTDPELATIRKSLPEFSEARIPKGTYKQQSNDQKTVGLFNFSIANKDMSDDLAYTITKHAIVGLTRAMALDHAREGIRINAICPGRVETPWVTARVKEYPDPKAAYEEMCATQPMGRMGRPEEVAAAALYLASDEASFVTGTTLTPDGGWSAG